MSVLFRTQYNVPEVYCDESRDFQLLCRAYDCIINGVKYDIDSMSYLTDTFNCKSSVLPLLQTKLGFFSKYNYNDEHIRYVLKAFPDIIKYKGSILAVREAINVFLKLSHVDTTIKVWYVSDSEVVYGTQVDDHTIIVGLNQAIDNMYILEEMMKYVMPTGFGFYFYFYSSLDNTDDVILGTKAELLFVSDNISSQVRGSGDNYSDSYNRLLGAVDTLFIASDDSIIPTDNGTYLHGDNSKFLGIFSKLSDITATPTNGQYCIAANKPYYYNGSWKSINFKGVVGSKYSDLPTSGRTTYDICGISNREVFYYKDSSNNWVVLKYRGQYNSLERVSVPANKDCVRIPTSVEGEYDYYIRLNNSWVKSPKVYFESSLNKIESSAAENSVASITGVTYWMFNGSKWVDNTLAIYIFSNYIGGVS